MPQISIIVAAFNVEKYILRCVNSVLSQNITDLELLVVNDGSTDNTLEVLKSVKDKRLRILNKSNGGLSDARNYGIKNATGDYIAFLDGDDYVEKTMYEVLLNKAKENNSDVVECSYYMDYPQVTKIKDVSKKITKDTLILPYNAWNKLIRKNILDNNNLLFLKNVWYEDFNFNLKLRCKINRANYVVEPLYHYEQRSDSIMHTTSLRIKDIFIVIDDVLDYYKKNEIIIDESLEYLIVKELLISSLRRFIKYKKETGTDMTYLIKKYLMKNFPSWRKNKKLRVSNIINLYLFQPFLLKKYILETLLFFNNN